MLRLSRGTQCALKERLKESHRQGALRLANQTKGTRLHVWDAKRLREEEYEQVLAGMLDQSRLADPVIFLYFHEDLRVWGGRKKKGTKETHHDRFIDKFYILTTDMIRNRPLSRTEIPASSFPFCDASLPPY